LKALTSVSLPSNALPEGGRSYVGTAALALCYIAFPVSKIVADAIGLELWRNWIDIAWLALALCGILGRARIQVRIMNLLIFSAGLVLWISAGALLWDVPTISVAMEIKPLFYLSVALLIFRGRGSLSPATFCQMGGLLSVLLVAEVLVRSLLVGGLERPIGSGEVNYDAALLCLSLVFAMGRGDLTRRYGPLIFFGLIATFSRTGLAAACVVLLFTGTVPVGLRVLMMGAAFSAAVMSFVIRDLEIGSLHSMDRYWMWVVGIKHLVSNMASTALVTTPGSSIEVDIPLPLNDLWIYQQEMLEIDGIFPFLFHAMWLRLAITWGWLPLALLLLMTLNVLITRGRRSPQARALAGVILVLGLTMGLVYLSNVGVPMFLAAFQLFASNAQAPQLNRFPTLRT
jgi:hypothetical protein